MFPLEYIVVRIGLVNKKCIAPTIFKGTRNKETFETYVETILVKELTPKQIVVMNNINLRKTNRVRE